ncbi:MAG: complex I NDUFA9 subunit family protein [Burkholderiales bacterium]|nr:complex I NDUFA9 subunit family protein [Burkholderiales bacterium]
MNTTSPPSPPSRVLVLGGTGFVGRSVCERWLRRAGGTGRVRVPTRRLAHARALQPLPTAEIVQADVHDRATLERLLAGCDAVVNLVAILHGRPADFERVHVELPRSLAAACRAAGVTRVVHVSALGVPDGAPESAPSNYLRSKARGEVVLRDAGLALTVLRPSVMFGADDRFLNLFARLQALAPFMPLAGAEARFQPVWVEDVAGAIVAALERRDTIGRIFECAGPREYTLAELVRLAGRCAGHERAVLPLPDSLGRVQAALMALAPGEPLMSADNLESMKVPNVASGRHEGLEALGITPAALEAVAPSYLGPHPGRARFGAFRARARQR